MQTTNNTDQIKSTTVYTASNNKQVALQVRKNKKGSFYVTFENGQRIFRNNWNTMSRASRQRSEYGHNYTDNAIELSKQYGNEAKYAKVLARMQIVK